MSLDPRFIPAGYFQLYFVDKDTGAPLSGGIVTFYSDENRTQLKPVYEISGTPPNYTYSVLPNPIILNGDGTFSDNAGNDIIPYFFPYVGVPSDENNTIDLYYITVDNSLGVRQFTREGIPNTTAADILTSSVENYIPNGQFLLHNNNGSQVLDNTSIPGVNVLEIAQGGWTFEVNSSSTSINSVVFQSFGGFVDPLPTSSPEFACRISCTSPNIGDNIKDLCINFYDVNKFSSSVNPPTNPQQYTFYFEGQSNSSGAVLVDIYVIKFFGIGGSSTQVIHKDTISVQTSYTQYQSVFDFGDNVGQTITNNDLVKIAIRFPVDALFDLSLTNFVLAQNNVNITSFPTTPNDEVISKSLGFLPTPDPNGNDLYLPLLYGPEGYFFDRSQIGKIFYTLSSTPSTGELIADGSTLVYADHSSDGIPFSRLGDILYSITSSVPGNPPPYGTGEEFVTTYQLTSNPGGALRFHTNKSSTPLTNSSGSVTPALSFTVNNDHSATNYFINSYIDSSNALLCEQQAIGTVDGTKFNNGTSVLTISVLTNAPAIKSLFNISGFVNVTGAIASTYFTFQSLNTPVNYYVWFKVDGSGTDPAPVGYTGIEVDLYSYYSATDFACAVREAISGYQLTSIVTTAGSSVIAGSYFTFSTSLNNYFVWYKVNGSGTQPSTTGIPILVEILSSDTAAQVALKTSIAMNKISYALPDYRGKFLRVFDNGSGVDIDSSVRLGHISYFYGDKLSTLEFDGNQDHLHSISITSTPNSTVSIQTGGSQGGASQPGIGASTGGGGVSTQTTVSNSLVTGPFTFSLPNYTTSGTTSYEGFSESRPINEYVNCVIKY